MTSTSRVAALSASAVLGMVSAGAVPAAVVVVVVVLVTCPLSAEPLLLLFMGRMGMGMMVCIVICRRPRVLGTLLIWRGWGRMSWKMLCWGGGSDGDPSG